MKIVFYCAWCGKLLKADYAVSVPLAKVKVCSFACRDATEAAYCRGIIGKEKDIDTHVELRHEN